MNDSNISDIITINNSPTQCFLSLENRARYKLIQRYNKPLSYHDVKMINDILYNEKTHYVEAFKEYLIYEDYNEFLKRFYKKYEINIKLPKILIFYEKYSKIYANYTAIPESKYMYKNIKRKQKMIDQMQNNDINSEFESSEESNEDISNTVFSSRVINSIYNKSMNTFNKSENSKNTEQSINDFLEKINNIENDVKNKASKNDLNLLNIEGNQHKFNKMRNNFLKNKNKTPPKSIKINNGNENKNLDIQINYMKKTSQKKNSNLQNKNNVNNNANNKNNYNNLIFINSYTCKTKHNLNTFKNNNSIGNYINICNNTFNNNFHSNNTFNGHYYFKTNTNFPKQQLSSATIKQNLINNSNNNITEQKSNMSLTNINNNYSNINNINNNQKYKLSLRETLFKLDKLILSTNSSNSPRLLNDNPFPTSSNKTNIFNNKNNIKHSLIKKKEKSESQKIKKDLKAKVSGLSSHKIMNAKKIRSNLLYHNYNSMGANLTFLSNNKFIEKNKIKNMYNKFSQKINNNKYNDNTPSNIKKPESHRNYYHSRVLSGNNSCNKNKANKVNISNNKNLNNNKNYKITVGNNKHQGIKIDSKKISFPCSPSSSNTSSKFYFQSQITSRKSSINKKKNTKLIKETNKKKVVNNFNIVNNIHDNSTQINIFTGKELYKSLRFQNKSLFNSASISPSNISPKSPYTPSIGHGNQKNKKQLSINKNLLDNNANKTNLKSNNKGKDKPIKHNLDFKKIINNQLIENEKAIVSERLITNNKKLFEKLGKYFIHNRKEKSITNAKYNNKKINSIKKSNNKNINNIKNKNSEYTRLINKIINHRFIKNKTNNNTPIKTRYIPCSTKNHVKAPSICLSSTEYENQMIKVNKASKGNNIKYNNIISNLSDLKNFGFEDGNKLLINSERNKISKIVFK